MKYTILMLALCTIATLASAQHIDLKAEQVYFESQLNHWSMNADDAEKAERAWNPTDMDTMVNEIQINLKAKTIAIVNRVSGKTTVSMRYSAVFQGAGQSVQLEPSQTLFLLIDPRIDMITYDESTQTMSLIYKDKRIRLYGRIKQIEPKKESEKPKK